MLSCRKSRTQVSRYRRAVAGQCRRDRLWGIGFFTPDLQREVFGPILKAQGLEAKAIESQLKWLSGVTSLVLNIVRSSGSTCSATSATIWGAFHLRDLLSWSDAGNCERLPEPGKGRRDLRHLLDGADHGFFQLSLFGDTRSISPSCSRPGCDQRGPVSATTSDGLWLRPVRLRWVS